MNLIHSALPIASPNVNHCFGRKFYAILKYFLPNNRFAWQIWHHINNLLNVEFFKCLVCSDISIFHEILNSSARSPALKANCFKKKRKKNSLKNYYKINFVYITSTYAYHTAHIPSSPPKCMYLSGKTFEISDSNFCMKIYVSFFVGSMGPNFPANTPSHAVSISGCDMPQERVWPGVSNSASVRIPLNRA